MLKQVIITSLFGLYAILPIYGSSTLINASQHTENLITEDKTKTISQKSSQNSSSALLKCTYKKTPINNNAQVASGYIIAQNSKTNQPITIKGRWYVGDSKMKEQTLFYTDTSYSTLQKTCATALIEAKIESEFTLLSASQANELSSSYPIWSIDSKTTSPARFTRIISFGDSLGDVGNQLNRSHGRIPDPNSWFHGHYTNGRIWSEYFSEILETPLISLAKGDARISIGNIAQQIKLYQKWKVLSSERQANKTLFVIQFGPNDLLLHPASAEKIQQQLLQAISLLQKSGGQYLLLPTIPDYSLTPYATTYLSSQQRKDLQKKIKMLNDAIRKIAKQAKKTALTVYVGRFDETYQFIYHNHSTFGFFNRTLSCLQTAQIGINNAPSNSCIENNGRYFYWDGIHSTTQVQALLAARMAQSIVGQF